ncbi:hypothetical protein MTHERMOG20_00410 [Moorella thermoacetica]|uniref:hypothetical protein n=1 Tax=Neomoorella thermoacetica TaxID=1525 RepID=UPI000AC96876|nr:hypothetical protein [Moorella thermoacetica]GLI15587.1 hypothetical protein MTHERMOG20_00410 [Moorella thermoacetica]
MKTLEAAATASRVVDERRLVGDYTSIHKSFWLFMQSGSIASYKEITEKKRLIAVTRLTHHHPLIDLAFTHQRKDQSY